MSLQADSDVPAAVPTGAEGPADAGPGSHHLPGYPVFEVFLQAEPGSPFTHVGEVESPDLGTAMLAAKEHFVRRDRCNAMWLVERRHVHLAPWGAEALAVGHRKVYRRSLGRGDADILPGRV